jgi:hypothetical protein
MGWEAAALRRAELARPKLAEDLNPSSRVELTRDDGEPGAGGRAELAPPLSRQKQNGLAQCPRLTAIFDN